MATSMKKAGHVFRVLYSNCLPKRYSNTLAGRTLEKHRKSPLSNTQEVDEETVEEKKMVAPRDYKFVYPEFLPNPDWRFRDRISEKLERRDMMRRRAVMNIPEFYVGSILAVTVADPHAPGKQNRFVGICISRTGVGLRARFILRNVIDGLGVEIMYDMYNPVVHKIEVLRLEKRLDEELFYLRDAPLEFSTIPFNMEAVPHPHGAAVPVNPLKVKLNPRPWHERWERREDLEGMQDLELPERFYTRAEQLAQPWEKWDLMKQYRKTLPEDEQEAIYRDVYKQQKDIDKKKGTRKGRGKKS